MLKGALPFMADLMRQLTIPVRIDLMEVSSYGGTATESSGLVRIIKDLSSSIDGRDVLVVEDIVDTGWTLRTILDLFRFRGARSVRLCALLDKHEAREVDVPIDYCGFRIGREFVVGYGLDFSERYRNLPYMAVVEFPDEEQSS